MFFKIYFLDGTPRGTPTSYTVHHPQASTGRWSPKSDEQFIVLNTNFRIACSELNKIFSV